MTRFRTLLGLGLASTMMVTAPVIAATPQHATVAATKSATHTPSKPATAALAPKRTGTTRSGAHLVKATQSNGKKVTYNCKLAGNKNKQACKG